MRAHPKRSDGQDETDMNIYEAAGPLPDGNYEGGWRIEPINNCPYCGRRVVIPKRSLLEVIQGGSKAPRD